VRDYVTRLVATGAAYRLGDVLAKGVALPTLPIYTRVVAPKSLGTAKTA
jgi:hypothetical protein